LGKCQIFIKVALVYVRHCTRAIFDSHIEYFALVFKVENKINKDEDGVTKIVIDGLFDQ